MIPEAVQSMLLEGFIRHLHALVEDDSFIHLKGVLNENNTLRERNNILNITNEENHRAISKLQLQLDDSTKRIEEFIAEAATLIQDKVTLEERVAVLESDAEVNEAQLSSNAHEIERLEKELSDKSTELETTAEELNSTKLQHEESQNECSKLETEVSSKATEIEALQGDLTDKAARLETSESQLEETRAELDGSKTQLESTTAELGNITAELENTRAELDSKKSQVEEIRDECTKIQADLDLKDSKLEELKLSLDEAKSALDASKLVYEELADTLKSTQGDLEAKNTRLGELNALSYKLKNPPQDQTYQHLRSMFTSACSWAEGLFASDLSESVFVTPASSTIWAKIRTHGRVNRTIPLPLSNTREAKQMRISAVLAILAWSLSQYIFQPTYLLQCNELSDLLAGLADDDPVRENYLRSVLLPILPSKQKANGKKRIEQAVTDVFSAISPALPSSKHDEVRNDLEVLCKQICGQWMRLQLLDEKIEPSFDAYDDEDWKVMNLPSFDSADGETAAEGDAPIDTTATESAIADDDRHQAITDIDEIAAVVWPSFLSFRGGESELVTEGFVLSKDQVRPAYNEEKAALLQGIHRAARQISRKDRTKSFATIGEDISIVKSFLPTESDAQSAPASSEEQALDPTEPESGPADEQAD